MRDEFRVRLRTSGNEALAAGQRHSKGTVKFANNQLTDAQYLGLVPVVNSLCWDPDRAVSLNSTIPTGIFQAVDLRDVGMVQCGERISPSRKE